MRRKWKGRPPQVEVTRLYDQEVVMVVDIAGWWERVPKMYQTENYYLKRKG